MNERLQLLDLDVAQYVDALMVLLVRQYEATHLPDLLSVFGPEKLAKFLTLFAGTTIQVPSTQILYKLARDADIYTTMKRGGEVAALARRYDMTQSEVVQVRARVARVVDEVVDGGGKAEQQG
jgi:Mor family transcriptional regulator